MKRTALPIITLIVSILIMAFTFSRKGSPECAGPAVQDTVTRYRDGVYEAQSRYTYTDEPYWGKVKITIENGQVAGIRFMIRDSNLHETFDGAYEKHFEGKPEYIQQSRNDWKGVQMYPVKFAELKNIKKVDAVSGATWSYNIFRACVEEALKNAK